MKTVANRGEIELQVPARSRLVTTAAAGGLEGHRQPRSNASINPSEEDHGNDEAQARNMLSPGLFCRDDRI